MTYTPTIERTQRARDRVVIDGVDFTHFRNAGATEINYELTEPYGYGPGSITFPDVSFLEEHLLDDLGFRDGAHVRIDRVMPGQGVVKRGVYHGLIFTKRISNGGLVVELAGHASGRLSQRWRPQPLVRKVRDCGFLAWQSFHEAGLRLLPTFGPETGTKVDNGEGGMYQLGWCDSVLELSYDGQPWTIMPREQRTSTYEMRRKDTTTVHCTVWADAFGVEIDVVDDVTEKPKAGYGSGTSPDGSEWVNGVWSDLGPEQVPAFPGHMSLGDTGEGVFVLKMELNSDGLLNLDALGDGTYNEAVVEAIETVQERAGLPVTGEVDQATWEWVWGDATENQRAASGHIEPLVIRSSVKRYLHTANGSIRGHNPDYDPEALRVDRHIDFGPGVSKARARRYWRHELKRANEGVNYYGTITLTTDVWEGDHADGTAGTIIEKEDIEGGWNIMVRKPGRDILFHIASARRSGNQVVLTVDTKARDALHIGEMIARDQEARRDFSRNWQHVQKASRQTHDAVTGWYREDGAGLIRRKVVCPGNQWTTFAVIGGQGGQVMRTTLETETPAAFVLTASGAKHAAEALARRVPDPWAKDADGELAWNDPEVQEWLQDRLFAYIIGDADQPGGYWPKKHTNAKGEVTSHPVTGKHKDFMSWPYVTFGGPILWVSIFPDRDTVLKPQELFRGSRSLGG